MEGSTFRKTAAVARSVFRTRPDTSPQQASRVNADATVAPPERWERVFAVVLKALSRFPEAYAAVTTAMREAEASP